MSVLDCRHIDIENIWYQPMVSSVCVTEDQGAFLVLHSREKGEARTNLAGKSWPNPEYLQEVL